jgi:hypothetical protein
MTSRSKRVARGYSDQFPTDLTPRTRYLLDYIPPKLWASVRRAARQDGISLRTLTLRLLTDWLARRHKRARTGTKGHDAGGGSRTPRG